MYLNVFTLMYIIHVELIVFFFSSIQADVDVQFEIRSLEKAEAFDPSWTDPQILCSKKGGDVEGGIGPFGLKVLASKGLEEYTAIFFRVFKAEKKHVVLMCSDQSRLVFCLLLNVSFVGSGFTIFYEVGTVRKSCN